MYIIAPIETKEIYEAINTASKQRTPKVGAAGSTPYIIVRDFTNGRPNLKLKISIS